MRFGQLVLVTLFLSSVIIKGQTATDRFEKFAIKQDSLFVTAYEKKDVKAYDKLLVAFLTQYNKLPVDDKKKFSGYLNGAYYNFCCTYSLLDNKPMALSYLKKSI